MNFIFSPGKRNDSYSYGSCYVEYSGHVVSYHEIGIDDSYGNYASPETIDDNDAYYIYTSGVVVLDDYTSNSYGRISPVVGYDYVRAYCVESDGIVVDGWNFGNFYGRTFALPEVDLGHVAYYVFSDGVVYSWNIVNSYGINSPDRTGYVTAYFVESDGNVYSGNGVDWAVTDSCGKALRIHVILLSGGLV